MKLYLLVFLSLLVFTAGAQVKPSPGAAGGSGRSSATVAKDITGAFSFSLATASHVSIGIFRNDSILVKTLLSDSVMRAGNHTLYWNGTDDYGKPITERDSLYKVKVLSNNIRYTWQGTIGNSSDHMTGITRMRGLYDCMKGLSFTSRYGYYCTGYGEGTPSVYKFDIATPNKKILLYPPAQSIGEVNYVANDGVTVYWGCYDPFDANHSWVFGTRISDDQEAAFSSGISFTPKHAKNFPAAIAYLNTKNGLISGLAVQRKGNYLFVARAGLNQVQVLNKKTGAIVQTLSVKDPAGLACDAADNLWMISGNTVAKYPVGSTGLPGKPLLTLADIVEPVAVQAHGELVSVLEGGLLQQVKFFNNNTGTATASLGTAGGYFTNATVTNDKFYFNDLRGKKLSFIAFQPDGSFWVNDPGNYRVQHYSSARKFINRIMSLGSVYSSWVDRNNISRVFANYLEFNVDYTVPLSGSSGWSLTKNWGANVTSDYDNNIFFLRHQTTFSNGRTYGFLRKSNRNHLVELTAEGSLRFTQIIKSGSAVLCKDGSIQEYDEGRGIFFCQKYPLTGFDALNNPTWSNLPETLASGMKTDNSPITFPTGQIFDSTNIVAFFNGHSMLKYDPPVYTSGYHLALMSKGIANGYLAKTEKSTHRNYGGDYPLPGWFDVGNLVNDYAGGAVNIVGRNIITSYHGEFWKASQVNKFNHYFDNGLPLGQFGITGPETRAGYAYPKMAGNVLSPSLVKDGKGNLYMWHGDESAHAGVHCWKITGLNTIHEQVFTIAFPSGYRAKPDYIDLMTGLPFDQSLVNNTAGWTRNPLNDNTQWIVRTSIFTYDKEKHNDIYIKSDRNTPGTDIVARDLGVNNVASSWKIAGNIWWQTSASYNSYPFYSYFEILDDQGKVLTNFMIEKSGNHPIYTSSIRFNKATLSKKTEKFTPTLDSIVGTLRPFSIEINKGVVTFSYSNFPPTTTTVSDAGANWRKPKTLRVRHYNDGMPGTAYGRATDLSDLKLYIDPR